MKRWALILLTLVVAEVLLWLPGRRSGEELRAAASGDDPRAAVFALHVLANRGETEPIERGRVRRLLDSEHAIVREYAMTWDGVRSAGPVLQRAYVDGLSDPAERARCDFYLSHQVKRPTLESLRAYLTHSSWPR